MSSYKVVVVGLFAPKLAIAPPKAGDLDDLNSVLDPFPGGSRIRGVAAGEEPPVV